MSVDPSQISPRKRPRCPLCGRPAAMCLCHFAVPVDTSVELLILQHPLEVGNAKGSADLLALCLEQTRLVAGERFDPDALQGLLSAGGRTPVLLYPATADLNLLAAPPRMLNREALPPPGTLRLVILDGTWRKSRKLLYLNPALQCLPRFSLEGMPPSHYRVRKAHRPDQLSTLEAVCYALAQIEDGADKFRPVLDAFDRFVDRLAAYQTAIALPDGVANGP